jgi:chromosomal replication initiation ATPase DnaA
MVGSNLGRHPHLLRMMAETDQLPLALALEPRFGAEDFLISACNADAHGRIESWPDWPSRMLLLTGPAASGKSHLAAIWAACAKAVTVSAAALTKAAVPALIDAGAVAVEDIDGAGTDEAALFHLLNLAVERGASMLLSASDARGEWPLRMPDLLSRLRRMPVVSIAAPDDALINALLVKMFVDRQLIVDTALVAFLSARLERSFSAVRTTVERLDRETLARGRRLTRPMAAMILGLPGIPDDS